MTWRRFAVKDVSDVEYGNRIDEETMKPSAIYAASVSVTETVLRQIVPAAINVAYIVGLYKGYDKVLLTGILSFAAAVLLCLVALS